MAKKLYHVGINHINEFISKNSTNIRSLITNDKKYELAKQFGRSYYELSINDFFIKYKINKDLKYAVKVLNIFKAYDFIEKIYELLQLSQFKQYDKASNIQLSSLKDHRKNIFYCFVYFLFTDINDQKKEIQDRLFSRYFLHYLNGINQNNGIVLNYKNMTYEYIKGKNITLKESFKIDEEGKSHFKILLNGKEKIVLTGTSIKTLRKKAYKQIFYYLIDNQNGILPKNSA